MDNRPDFLKNDKKKICLICEGYEEYDYISRLLELGVWSDIYDFTLVNAESNGNISARYQDRYQSDSYDIVLVLCDTDRKPHDDFELIRKKINGIFGNDTAADEVIIFVNPCCMQVMLSHFGSVLLKTQNKQKNAAEVERLTGIHNYSARAAQRKAMGSMINKANYRDMRKHLKSLAKDYTQGPATNFKIFLDRFESNDDSWIKAINDKIEE